MSPVAVVERLRRRADSAHVISGHTSDWMSMDHGRLTIRGIRMDGNIR